MNLVDFRDAIVATVKERLPHLKDCSSHGGRFTLDELKRWMTQAPGVKIAILNLVPGNGVSGGSRDYMARCVAVVVTRDAPSLPRDTSVLTIAQTLIETVYQNTWGLDDNVVFPAGAAAGKSLYSTELDRQGVAFWAIEWEQELRLPVSPPSDPVDPQLYVSMAPHIGADHVDDYVEVGGDDD